MSKIWPHTGVLPEALIEGAVPLDENEPKAMSHRWWGGCEGLPELSSAIIADGGSVESGT
ncbi:hypothetical protein [Nonomuraea dietziae]|uniref:hypothetical protein n=1 Tax=Nonomuraea dietziae TaxID=65515 RepID=UPI0031D54D35